MNQYLSSASLKSLAKGQLLGKYGTVIGAFMLHGLCIMPISMILSLTIGTGTAIQTILYCLGTFLVNLFAGFFVAGEAYIYLKVACNQKPQVMDLFYCFRGDTMKVLKLQTVFAVVSLVCSLPAQIVSGFVNDSISAAAYSSKNAPGTLPVNGSLFLTYVILFLAGTVIEIFVRLLFSQVFYLMLDFPQYTAKELFQMSLRLMKGNIGRLFYLQISFLPLILLSFLSCGIALLWISPYMDATLANFYLDLIKKKTMQEPSVF